MLTSAQLATLKAGIAADAIANAFPQTVDGSYDCATYLNTPSNPQVLIWLTNLTVPVLNSAVNWTAFEALTVQKQNAYFAMTQAGTVDASSASIRSGFATLFSGADLTALTNVAQRNASKFEAIFTVAGVCSLFGYVVSGQDVASARSA